MSEKNNIAIILYANPDNYPPTYNAIKLLSAKYNILLICRNVGHATIRLEYPANVQVCRIGKYIEFDLLLQRKPLQNIREYLHFIWEAIRQVKDSNVKILYCYDAYAFMAGYCASRATGSLPVIYHNHDLMEADNKLNLGWLVKRFEIKFADRSDLIIFPEPTRARQFANECCLRNMPIIVRNVPLLRVEKLQDKLKEVLIGRGYDGKQPVILYQGAIGPYHSILEAVESMQFWHVRGILVLIGYCPPDYAEKIKAAAEKYGVSDRVCLLPMVSYDQLFQYTAGATIGLAMYQSININWKHMGGASNKVFEYLANGVPTVLGWSGDSATAFLQQAAWGKLVNPDSPQEIAEAINCWLDNDELLEEARSAARMAHLNEFNYENEFAVVFDKIEHILCAYAN